MEVLFRSIYSLLFSSFINFDLNLINPAKLIQKFSGSNLFERSVCWVRGCETTVGL